CVATARNVRCQKANTGPQRRHTRQRGSSDFAVAAANEKRMTKRALVIEGPSRPKYFSDRLFGDKQLVRLLFPYRAAIQPNVYYVPLTNVSRKIRQEKTQL